MNYDFALISKVLEEKDIATAIREGADKPGMLTPEARVYWELLKEHHSRFHQVPSLEIFKTQAPSYQHVPVHDSIEVLVDGLKTRRLSVVLQNMVSRVIQEAQKDPWKAKSLLLEKAEELAVQHSKTNNYYLVGEDREETLAQLQRLRDAEGLLGYPWPWAYLNRNSLGVCAGEVYYLYGRQKSRKTFFAIFMALFYWSIGLKVLFFTREMSFEKLKWRIIATYLKLNYLACVKNQLGSDRDAEIGAALDDLFNGGRFIICDVQDGISGYTSHVLETKPDIIFHDYFKAMADDAMGSKVTSGHSYVARTVDQVVNFAAKKYRAPVFIIGHANRKGIGAKGKGSDEHAWSDHITRRVEAAFRVITDRRNNRTAFFLNEARSMQDGLGMTLDATLCEGLGNFISSDYSWIKDLDEDKQDDEESEGKKEDKKEEDFPEEIDLSCFG